MTPSSSTGGTAGRIAGRVWRFGDDIDTDQIIPSQYLVLGSIADMSRHCMETQRPDFAAAVHPGDILVAGRNFGCGSSREQAPMVLKQLGIAAVVAQSFARIFFRNAINTGLMPIVLPDTGAITEGLVLTIDAAGGTLGGADDGIGHRFTPLDEYPQRILNAGGLINFLREEGQA